MPILLMALRPILPVDEMKLLSGDGGTCAHAHGGLAGQGVGQVGWMKCPLGLSEESRGQITKDLTGWVEKLGFG